MNREDEIAKRWGLAWKNTDEWGSDHRWLVTVARVARSMVEDRVHFDPTKRGDRGRSLMIELREVLNAEHPRVVFRSKAVEE